MTQATQEAESSQVEYKKLMVYGEVDCFNSLSWPYDVNSTKNRYPFVDFRHHLCWFWIEFGFDFSLEVWEEPISQQGNQKNDESDPF